MSSQMSERYYLQRNEKELEVADAQVPLESGFKHAHDGRSQVYDRF